MIGPVHSILISTSPYGPIALTELQLHETLTLANEIVGKAAATDHLAPSTSHVNQPRLLDAREAALLLGIDPKWLLQKARENRLPFYRIGKYVRFDPNEIRASSCRGPDRHANS